MGFYNKDSQMVKSALLLFEVGRYTDISQVPNLFNLREVVAQELLAQGKITQEDYDKEFN